jgi:hypothetical protein
MAVSILASCKRFHAHAFAEPRANPVVMGKLAWKPFDLRFEDILASFECHRVIIATTLRLQGKEKKSEDRLQSHIERVTAERHRIGKKSSA